jgi:hypothetical protein
MMQPLLELKTWLGFCRVLQSGKEEEEKKLEFFFQFFFFNEVVRVFISFETVFISILTQENKNKDKK